MAEGDGTGAGGGDGTGGGGAGDGGGEKPISLTSAQLNERLERATRTATADFIKSLGYEKPEELKAALDAKKAADDAAKSALELAQEKATQADARAKAADERANGALIRTAAFSEATKAGVPADRIDHAIRLIDLTTIEVGADGSVKGAAEAVTALLEGAPWLKGDGGAGGGKPNVGAGAGGGSNGGGAKPVVLTADQKAMAKAQGISEEAYARGLLGKPGSETHAEYVATHKAEAAKSGAKQ